MAVIERIDDYSYVRVRVTAARGKMLKTEQLYELADSASVDDLKQRLVGLIKDIPPEAVTTSKDIEQTFHDAFFKYIDLIVYNAPHECQEFVLQYVSKYALDNLKDLVVGKILQLPERELRDRFFLPVERLMRTEGVLLEAARYETLEQVAYSYKHTIYGELLRDVISQYNKTNEVFFVYASLDKHYIENLNMMLLIHSHWSRSEREFVKTLVGTLTDFYNLVCATRGQINGFTQAEIRIITTAVQFDYLVYFDDFDLLYEQGSDKQKIVSELKKILLRYPCGKEFVHLIVPERIMMSLRQFYYNVLLKQVKKHRFEQGQELGEVISFLVEKEAEIDNIITIFEGVKNKVGMQAIKQMLILRTG